MPRRSPPGVRLHGCSVHFVTPALDGGPIVAQAAVPVQAGDDEASLARRVLAEEHLLYPRVARWFLEGRLHAGRWTARAGEVSVAGALHAPRVRLSAAARPPCRSRSPWWPRPCCMPPRWSVRAGRCPAPMSRNRRRP
jgi:hypothetical protein